MKRKISEILLFIFLCFCVIGCKDSLDKQLLDLNHDISFFDSEQEDDGPDSASINQTALDYLKNIEKAIFSVIGNTKTYSTSLNNCVSPEIEDENPFTKELENLEIVNKNGKSISFFSLPDSDKHILLDKWASFQASQITTKIYLESKVEARIKELNDTLKNILSTQTYTDGCGNLRFRKNANIFSRLNNVKQIQNIPFIFSEKSCINYKKPAKNDNIEKVASILSKNGVSGNLLVRLAVDWFPYTFINMENGNLGHVGILTKNIQNSKKIEENDTISIAAQTKDFEGDVLRKVRYEKIKEWCNTSYIMEIGHTKVIWKGAKSCFKFIPFASQGDIANKAKGYLGVRYVYGEEFLTAKFAAPEGFTCATLAWYCAKKICRYDISLPIALCVSPEDIYLSWHTRIKAKIKI